MNSTEYDYFPKMMEEKFSLPLPLLTLAQIQTFHHSIPYKKKTGTRAHFGSFPTDLYLSLGVFRNQPMAKALLFNIYLQYFEGIKEGLLIDRIYIKAKSIQNNNRKNKKIPIRYILV